MNKYKKIYEALVKKAQDRDFISKRWKKGTIQSDGPVEAHHIIPKSMGGLDKRDNIVVFTPKEHFIAHMLLIKIYNGNYKMIKALVAMCMKLPNKSAEDYRIIRESKSHMYSEQSKKFYERLDAKKIISDKGKEVWAREGYKEKMSKSLAKRMEDPEYSNRLSLAQKKACEDPKVKANKYKSIEKHSKEKSKEWVDNISKIAKERMNRPEWKEKYSKRYHGSNFDRSRKVLDKLDGTVYNSAVEAAKARSLKVEVVKKWLYKRIPKHNLVWLDEQETENGEIGNNSESGISSGESSK